MRPWDRPEMRRPGGSPPGAAAAGPADPYSAAVCCRLALSGPRASVPGCVSTMGSGGVLRPNGAFLPLGTQLGAGTGHRPLADFSWAASVPVSPNWPRIHTVSGPPVQGRPGPAFPGPARATRTACHHRPGHGVRSPSPAGRGLSLLPGHGVKFPRSAGLGPLPGFIRWRMHK